MQKDTKWLNIYWFAQQSIPWSLQLIQYSKPSQSNKGKFCTKKIKHIPFSIHWISFQRKSKKQDWRNKSKELNFLHKLWTQTRCILTTWAKPFWWNKFQKLLSNIKKNISNSPNSLEKWHPKIHWISQHNQQFPFPLQSWHNNLFKQRVDQEIIAGNLLSQIQVKFISKEGNWEPDLDKVKSLINTCSKAVAVEKEDAYSNSWRTKTIQTRRKESKKTKKRSWEKLLWSPINVKNTIANMRGKTFP